MKISVRESIIINRPPEAVAAVLMNADKAVLWNTDLQKFEVVSERPGMVGSKARLHYVQDGKPYVMEDELLEAEPNRRYLSRVTGDALEAEVETWLVPFNGGTEVTICWSGAGKPLLLRLLLPFMRRTIARGVQTDLGKLKTVVESGG